MSLDFIRIAKRNFVIFLLAVFFISGCQSELPVRTLSEPRPMTATITYSDVVTPIPSGSTVTPLPANTDTPTITPTPNVLPDKAEVDWESLSSVHPGYYILYEDENNFDLYILSSDGSINKKIVTGGENWRNVYYWIDRYNARILNVETYNTDHFVFNFTTRREVSVQQKMNEPELPACRNYDVSRDQKWGIFVCGGAGERFMVLKNANSNRYLKIPSYRGVYGKPLEYDPISWSPDNHWIAYLQIIPSEIPYGYYELMLVDTSCLNKPDDCPFNTYGPFIPKGFALSGMGPLIWSPDSRFFGTVSNLNVLPILTFSPSDKTFHKIQAQNGEFGANDIAWSPDGSWISFSEGSAIYLISKNGGIAKQITHEQGSFRLIGWISTYPDTIFEVGRKLFVTGAGDLLQARQSPGFNKLVAATLVTGTDVELIDGPQEVDGQRWWKVKTVPGGIVGWVVENPDWYGMRQ